MLPIDIRKLDHVAVATWDVTALVSLLTTVLGAAFVDADDEVDAGFRWLQFELGGGKIEVLEPLDNDGFLHRFLTKRGEGLHHVTLYVNDLPNDIHALTEAGYVPVDVSLENDFWKEAFIHPRDTSGVLIQLAQTIDRPDDYTPPRTLEEYLADRPDVVRPS